MFDNFDVIAFSRHHWPFLVVALVLGLVGEILKKVIAPNGLKNLKGWRWWWYTTLPLHPAGVGLLLGLSSILPCADSICTSRVAAGLYYMGAGMLSSYVYALVKHVAREKLGNDAPTSVPPPSA